MKAHISALRAIVAAAKCLDGCKSYIDLAEAILEIKAIAEKALGVQPDPGSLENRAVYFEARLTQAQDFLWRIYGESTDRHAKELAGLGVDGIQCDRCRIWTLETLKKAQDAGWRIRHQVRGPAYFLCPDHAAEARRYDRGEMPVMRPQRSELGPERGH